MTLRASGGSGGSIDFYIFPFNEFALRIIKIPTATSVTVTGNEVRFSWLEDGGFFASEDEANIACLTDRFSYQALPFGRSFPSRSAQFNSPTIFPRATNPRKRARPTLSLIIKDRKKDEQERQTLAECLTQLNQVLDR